MSQRGYDSRLDGPLENYRDPMRMGSYGGRSNYRDRFQPNFQTGDLFGRLGGGNLQRNGGGFGGGLQGLFGRIGQQTGQMRGNNPPPIRPQGVADSQPSMGNNRPVPRTRPMTQGPESMGLGRRQNPTPDGNNLPKMPQYGNNLPRMPQYMPFPSPGRKGQRNRPQPGGYYPQPPSSPNYPGGGFPSPGRKGSRSGYQRPSYQQPRTPYGYGQMQNNSYRFGNSGIPQNIYGFQDPHYQPYQPPYNPSGQPGGPPDDGRADSAYSGGDVSNYGFSTGFVGPENDGSGTRGGMTTNPGGKGGSINNSIPFVPPYITDNDPNQQTVDGGYAGGFNQQQPIMGGGFGGGFGGGKGMNGGGRTAFPRNDVLSSYMNR